MTSALFSAVIKLKELSTDKRRLLNELREWWSFLFLNSMQKSEMAGN